MSGCFKFARLLGLDLIRDIFGRWWILEVNDVPCGLAHAELLAGKSNSSAHAPVKRLADKLLNISEGQPVLLLRPPPSFNVDAKEDDRERDYNAVACAIQHQGGECIVACPDELEKGSSQSLRDGRTFGAVYRRTHVRPDCSPEFRTINPAEAVYVCRDKQRAADLLSGLVVPHVPTYSGGVPCLSESGWYIAKPRYGSGSRGIHRIRKDELDSHVSSSKFNVIQPWIEPDTINISERDRYFDLRLFVLDGEIIGAFARCSVAPRGGIGSGTELEWLTTLGSICPVEVTVKRTQNDCVNVTPEEEAMLHRLARDVASRVDAATAAVAADDKWHTGSRNLPYIFIAPSGHSAHNDPASRILLENVSQNEPIALVDVGSEPLEWEALRQITRWPLMPQMLVGDESFLGNQVIEQAFASGEFQRAVSRVKNDVFKGIHLSPRSIVQKDSVHVHGGAVWGASSTFKGITRVSGAADGSIRVARGERAVTFQVSTNWINCVSVSPCGRTLVCGTSDARAFLIDLDDSIHPERLVALEGHQRWVNGVAALDRKRIATISSDGEIVLWHDDKPVAKNKHTASGHVLGMKAARGEALLSWSSDGKVARWSTSDLSLLDIWQVPTEAYVTAAAEAVINASDHTVAVDVEGNVYSSAARLPLFNCGSRAWGIVAMDAIGALVVLTVGGNFCIWRHSQPERPLEITQRFPESTPTIAHRIEGTLSIFVGFSDGSTRVVDV